MYLKPAPEQLEDAAKMAALGDLPNFSGAGTGKTVTALEAIRIAKRSGGLIVGPLVSLNMWKSSVEDQLGANAGIMWRGSSPIPDADFVIVPYSLLSSKEGSWRLTRRFRDIRNTALVLDESHNVRRASSKRTEKVYGVNMSGEDGLIQDFDQVWPMSGNPIFRYADDLWPMLRALHPDQLHAMKSLTYDQFVRNFCRVKKVKYHERMREKWEVCGNTNEAALNIMLYERIRAIRRKDVVGLPELRVRELVVPIKMPHIEGAAEIKNMPIQQLMDLLNKENGMLMQISQAINLAKLEASAEYLIDSAANGPLLLGVWFNETGAAADFMFKSAGLKSARVYGATPVSEREEIRKRFNGGDLDVIVGQMASMGTSWNLQERCTHVAVLEDNVSPGVIEQFYKRVYRRGQKKPCMLDFLRAEHRIEEAIKMVRERKETGASIIIDGEQ